MKRVVTISDIHIDHRENRSWLEQLCHEYHGDEILILAGDVASNFQGVKWALEQVSNAYSQVFFVPGNHDLWVRRDEGLNSLQRFTELLDLCSSFGVVTRRLMIPDSEGRDGLLIVPLFSWYAEADEGDESLFLPKKGEDNTLAIWADRVRIRWPEFDTNPASYFLGLNRIDGHSEAEVPMISFSHFLPRQDLIFSSKAERERFGDQGGDRAPSFNFSRVAGSAGIERQIRHLGSTIHVHGHQHRNRDRVVDGIRYVSHCLGYPQERLSEGGKTVEVRPFEIFRF
jgi:hypothetical protein